MNSTVDRPAWTRIPLDARNRLKDALRVRQRWRALDRASQATFAVLAVLVAGAVAVRVWFMAVYPTAFMGFPDASQYALAAGQNIFRDAQRPAGYPFFLRLVHHFSEQLSFTIAVQHALGVAAGLLLYKAVRRTGAPAWLGLLPAVVVFFGGTGLILEHALLGDSLFAFLQALGLYLAVRALYDERLRWVLLAGLAIGVDFWVKTAALASGALVPVVLMCATSGGFRRRLRSALVLALTVAGMVAVYVGAQYYFTGYLGYERQGAWNAYGRVATFVDCATFKAPPGTRFLCPSEPVARRRGPSYYIYEASAPAVRRFGPPYKAPPEANGVLEKFALAAIEQQPLAYARTILRGLSYYVFPREGEGYTPQGMREEVIEPERSYLILPEVALLYPHSPSYVGPPSRTAPLKTYERYTRVEGPLLILLLGAGLLGPLFLRGPMRWATILCTLTALCSITFAVAGNSYDARYAYPTFGPLAAGAALGGWGIATALARRRRRAAEATGRP